MTHQRRTGPPRRAKAQQNAKRARVDAAERRSEAKAVFGDGYIEAMKTAIAMDYVVKHRAPDPKYWEGRHGCILAIRKEYHKMMKRRFVKKVLTEVHACILKGEVWFDPGRAHGGGAQALIPPGSKYERTVVNSLEKGASHKLAMEIVNRELEQDGGDHARHRSE